MRSSRVTAIVLCLATSSCGRSELPEVLLRPQVDQLPTSLPQDCSAPTPHEAPALNVRGERWDRGCIAIRYTDDMAQFAPQLESALEAWAAPCSWLCFEHARPWEAGDADRRNLLLIGDRGVTRPTDLPLSVEWSFKPHPIVATWSHQVALRQRRDASLTRADFVRAVGLALGFDALAGVESSLDGLHEAPTQADLQSACAVYPRCP
jgi:hypothetical protein